MLIFCSDCRRDPLTCGSSALSASSRVLSAPFSRCSSRIAARFCWRPRSTASFSVSGSGVAESVPCGTPRSVSGVGAGCAAAGRAIDDGGGEAQRRASADRRGFIATPGLSRRSGSPARTACSMGPATQPRRRCLAMPVAAPTISTAVARGVDGIDQAVALRAGQQRLPGLHLRLEDHLEALHRLLAHLGAHLEDGVLAEVLLAIEEPEHPEEEGVQLVLDVAGAADRRHRLVLELGRRPRRGSAGRCLPWTCSRGRRSPSPRPRPGRCRPSWSR